MIDNTIAQKSSVMPNEGTGTSNVGWIEAKNIYRYRNIAGGYTAAQAALNKGACSYINVGGSNTAKAINPTDVAAGKGITELITTWGGAWDFATANTVKLLSITVLTVTLG